MGINSYEGHSFVVEPWGVEKDAREDCVFWASAGECEKNPGYMLKECAKACGHKEARFTVGSTEEYLTVDSEWRLYRTGPARRASESAKELWADCQRTCESEEVCGDLPACVKERAEEDFLGKTKLELDLERKLFEKAYDAAPRPPLDPEQPTEDLQAVLSAYETAKNFDIAKELSCVDEASCVTEIGNAAVLLYSGVDSLRKATRRRGTVLRNSTCDAATKTIFLKEAVSHDDTLRRRHPQEEEEEASYEVWVDSRRDEGAASNDESKEYLYRDLFFQPSFLPGARISHVKDFVTSAECEAMMDYARPRLRRATHAKDGDMSAISSSRDAQQATVNAKAVSEAKDVQARAVALANDFSNYSLSVDGQEDLMAIQYNPGQQYMLHCDGSCDGTPFLKGGRLATVLMFCRDATQGGATNFPNAGVHVKPKAGDAVYFHFRGPTQDGLTDPWHTEHSGCPVKLGEKWVITQWLRDGVSKENPAYIFSPFGGPS